MNRTRAAEVRKRKLGGEELSSCSSSLVQLKRRQKITVTGENSDDPCVSPTSNNHALSSCSSSSIAKEKFTTADLLEEDEEASSVEITRSMKYNMEHRERREATPSSELQAESVELEFPTVQPSEASSCHRSMAVKVPSNAELEDFFSAVEKHLPKHFTEKYNFDFEKEEPLKGRFIWNRVKP